MNPLFEQIDQLKTEWDTAQPLTADAERKLWQKIRLDWNYHSNHIEGNTLTYGETQLLLLHGQTHGDHQLREYEEMKAHDVGIAHVRDLAADSRFIGEGDVRNLNQIILKEPFWKDARTADGQPSRKQIIPGEYKSTPNNVITATGELFEFAPPADVPIRMRELLTQLEERLGNGKEHISAIIAWFHHQFVLIHPFDDGNGRVARLLVNYLLLRGGYLPIIVPTEEKASYLGALRLADAGEPASFADYLGQRIKSALEMGIRASKGESIEEPGDLEKEIQLFVRNQEFPKNRVERSAEIVREISEQSIKELFQLAIDKMKVFAPLFLTSKNVINSPSRDPISAFDGLLEDDFSIQNRVSIDFQLKGYRGDSGSGFEVTSTLSVDFKAFEYVVAVDYEIVVGKSYSEALTSSEAVGVIDRLLEVTFFEIKSFAEDLKS